jgi:hypothetical protein
MGSSAGPTINSFMVLLVVLGMTPGYKGIVCCADNLLQKESKQMIITHRQSFIFSDLYH